MSEPRHWNGGAHDQHHQRNAAPAIEEGIVSWRVPLGEGAVAHVALEDCAYYARWLFDNPARADGLNLEVAIEPVAYADLAAAFQRVTGRPARYIDTPLDAYFNGPYRQVADRPAGYNADPHDKSTMSFKDNSTGFWNQWKHNIITRDYAMLNEIHPGRIKTVEAWLRREERRGRDLGMGGFGTGCNRTFCKSIRS